MAYFFNSGARFVGSPSGIMRSVEVLVLSVLIGAEALRVRAPLAVPTAHLARSSPIVAQTDSQADIAESASNAADQLVSMLTEGTPPPDSLPKLKEAIQKGEPEGIAAALYVLLVDQALDYDLNDDKQLVKTDVDYANKEDPRVKEKLAYVYTYGIGMFKRGYISADTLKQLVLDKVASRVGMDGPAFDKWLEIPAVAV